MFITSRCGRYTSMVTFSLSTPYRMQIVPYVCPELSILAATVPAGHPAERLCGVEEGLREGRGREGRRRGKRVDVEQKWKDGEAYT